MQKIRIVSTPPGGAPEWVRKEWVGLELPVADLTTFERASGRILNVSPDRPPENEGGYPVRFDEAIPILREKSRKSREAAIWWCQWEEDQPSTFQGILVFKKEVCQLIA
jgi:hypothetical protein